MPNGAYRGLSRANAIRGGRPSAESPGVELLLKALAVGPELQDGLQRGELERPLHRGGPRDQHQPPPGLPGPGIGLQGERNTGRVQEPKLSQIQHDHVRLVRLERAQLVREYGRGADVEVALERDERVRVGPADPYAQTVGRGLVQGRAIEVTLWGSDHTVARGLGHEWVVCRTNRLVKP